jgi:tRNA(Glu) U13 pseudouridine synthase TruD
MEPPADSESGALERRALADVGATREDFARAGRELPGARRPVVVAVELGDPAVAPEPPPAFAARTTTATTPETTSTTTSAATRTGAAVRIRFSLPSGSYATVVIDSLLDSPRNSPIDSLSLGAPVDAHKVC